LKNKQTREEKALLRAGAYHQLEEIGFRYLQSGQEEGWETPIKEVGDPIVIIPFERRKSDHSSAIEKEEGKKVPRSRLLQGRRNQHHPTKENYCGRNDIAWREKKKKCVCGKRGLKNEGLT